MGAETQGTPSEKQQQARDLTAFQWNILVVLSEESMYGLAIKEELESYYGSEVNHGRLYPNLDQLNRRGLISKDKLDKRTNVYEVTERGKEAMLDRLGWQFSKLTETDRDVSIIRHRLRFEE